MTIRSQINHKPQLTIYFTLLFSVFIILASWFIPRIIYLYGLMTNAGITIFACAFLFIGLITEIYGFKQSRFTIWIGLIFYAFSSCYSHLSFYLPRSEYAIRNNEIFSAVHIPAVGEMLTLSFIYLLSTFLYAITISWLKRRMEGRCIRLRLLIALSVLSLSLYVILDLFFLFNSGLLNDELATQVVTSPAVIFLIGVLALPLLSFVTKKIQQIEKIDIYDTTAYYMVFSLDTEYLSTNNKFTISNKVFLDG